MSSDSPKYPMTTSGGLFLALVGSGLFMAVVLGGDNPANLGVFFVGMGLGVVALIFARKLSRVRPTRGQIIAMNVAIALEVLLFIAQGQLLPRGTEASIRWMWTSMIVGVHFLPMAICFGPRMLLLGTICIALASTGLVFPSLRVEPLLIVDALAKLAIGLWMFSDRYQRSGTKNAA
jgi:hypothetical protein